MEGLYGIDQGDVDGWCEDGLRQQGDDGGG